MRICAWLLIWLLLLRGDVWSCDSGLRELLVQKAVNGSLLIVVLRLKCCPNLLFVARKLHFEYSVEDSVGLLLSY